MKSWLLGILASLLTFSLCGAIISTTLNDTVVNAQYLESKFAAINGYNRLSTALTNDVVEQSGISDISQASSVVSGIVTPAAVKQKVNSAFSEVQAYMQGKGPTPAIDLSGLAAQAQTAGIPIGQGSSLLQTTTLGPKSSSLAHVNLNLSSISRITMLASAALGAVILAFSLLWRRYTVLPAVLISAGVIMVVITVVVYLALGRVSHYLTFSGGQNSYVTLGRDLAQEIGKDLARRFGFIAVACLVVGIASRILIAVFQKKTASPLQPNTYQTPTTSQPSI